MLYATYTNKYFSYSEMDINGDGFVHPGELSYYSEVGTRTVCDTKNGCVLEVFSLKDGLPLKTLPIQK